MTGLSTAAPSDEALLAELRVMQDAEMAAAPDPAYVARERALLAVLCRFYAAGNAVADPDDYDVTGCGGVYVEPGAWPVRGRFDLGALGTAVDADARDATGGAK